MSCWLDRASKSCFSRDLEDVVAVMAARAKELDLAQVRETVLLVEQAIDQSDLSPVLDACWRRAMGTPVDDG